MKKKVRRVVLGEGYLGPPLGIRFYCGLPVWEHNFTGVDDIPHMYGKKVRLVAEVIE